MIDHVRPPAATDPPSITIYTCKRCGRLMNEDGSHPPLGCKAPAKPQ